MDSTRTEIILSVRDTNFTRSMKAAKLSLDGLNHNIKQLMDTIRKMEDMGGAAQTVAQIGDSIKKVDGVTRTVVGTINTMRIIMGKTGTVVDILTKKMEALNTTKKNNPIGLKLAAAVLVIGAIGGIIAIMRNASDETDNWNTRTKEAKEANNELLTSVRNSRNAFEREARSIRDNRQATDSLIDSIEALYSNKDRTVTQTARLQAKIARLNSRVEGLNLSYDEQTGILSKNIGLVRDFANVQQHQLDKVNAMERYNDVALEMKELDRQIAEGKELLAEGYENARRVACYATGEIIVLSNRATKALQADIDEMVAAHQEAAAERKRLDAEIVLSMARTQQAHYENVVKEYKNLQQALGNRTATLDMFSDTQQSALNELQGQWQSYFDIASDMFNAFERDSEVSLESMVNNLKTSNDNMERWARDLEALAYAGVDQGLLQKLRDGGPQGAAAARAMVEAVEGGGIEALDGLTEQWSRKFDTTNEMMDASLTVMGAEFADGVDEVFRQPIEAVPGKFKSLTDAFIEGTIETAQAVADTWRKAGDEVAVELEAMGQASVEGYVDGVSSEADRIENVVGMAMIGGINTADLVLRRNSPSKVYMRMGEDTVRGYALGVESKSDALNATMKKVGQNAMDGFTNGINIGGARAIEAANRIANQVAATMKSALEMNSPSRVMRKIGRGTGRGFEFGLLDMIRPVERASAKLSNVMTSSIEKASVALGSDLFQVQVPDFTMAGGFNHTMEMAVKDFGYEDSTISRLVDGFKEALKEDNRTYVMETVVDLDGREIARSTKAYLPGELAREEKRDLRKQGRRI